MYPVFRGLTEGLVPRREIDRLQGEMNRMLSAFFDEPKPDRWLMSNTSVPPLNVALTEPGATITAEAPGLRAEDLDVQVQGNTLTLTGNQKAQELKKGQTWLRRERYEGELRRTIELPFAIDAEKVQASYTNGVLEVRLLRSPKHEPKRIAVTSA